MTTRNKLGALLLCVLVPVLAFVWLRRINPPDYSISATGGEILVSTNAPITPYHLQADEQWAGVLLGGSGERFADVGCTVCCVSMAFTHLGFPISPKELNAELIMLDGYTDRGWLKWHAASAVTRGTITFTIPKHPTHALIDDAIKAKQPVIAKVLLWESMPHWVLIVGKDQNEYLIKNPLHQDRTLQKLSEISSRIHSVRIAKGKSKK
jgi:hypothetical protein